MFKRLTVRHNRHGQTMTEYGLVVVSVAIAVILVLVSLGGAIGGTFSSINSTLGGVSGGGSTPTTAPTVIPSPTPSPSPSPSPTPAAVVVALPQMVSQSGQGAALMDSGFTPLAGSSVSLDVNIVGGGSYYLALKCPDSDPNWVNGEGITSSLSEYIWSGTIPSYSGVCQLYLATGEGSSTVGPNSTLTYIGA